jgi:hypothetical protein
VQGCVASQYDHKCSIFNPKCWTEHVAEFPFFGLKNQPPDPEIGWTASHRGFAMQSVATGLYMSIYAGTGTGSSTGDGLAASSARVYGPRPAWIDRAVTRCEI